mmetsp:Transcript_9901/g.11370  ORF Transcript_9901/g.11370 Transcript_9901/m.11370 type:complete len:474 (+) Transcript_9901:97-1518(+)
MKKLIATIMLQVLLAVAAVHGSIFLPRATTTTTTTTHHSTLLTTTTHHSVVIANIIGLPRGGGEGRKSKSNSSSLTASTVTASVAKTVKETYTKITSNKRTPGSKVMLSSLMLLLAGYLCNYSMNMIPNLYPTQASFLFGENIFGRKGADVLCNEGKSILYAYPDTVSETLTSQTGITNLIVGNLGTLSAILFMASKLGDPSSFPIEASQFGNIFNFVRLVCPLFVTFLVPKIPTRNPHDINNPGELIQQTVHGKAAMYSWLLCPTCEVISSVLSLVSFFRQNPQGDKFIPSDAAVEENSKTWVGTFYKSLWIGSTIARAVLSVAMLYFVKAIFFPFFLDHSNRAQWFPPAINDCEVLTTIQSCAMEWSMCALLGGLYVLLAISQLVESSGRKLSSLLYLLPIIVFSSKSIGKTISTLLMTFNIKENYLKIINMPGGKLTKKMAQEMGGFFNKSNPDWNKCSIALKDIDNCNV